MFNSGNTKSLHKNYRVISIIISVFLLSSCVPFVKVSLQKRINKKIISGIISPFQGLISYKSHSSFLMSEAYAVGCADPVYAQLFELKQDGTIDTTQPVESQLVGADAKYTFSNFSESESSNVQYLVRAIGCNDDVYQRPVTSFDNSQNLTAITTVVAEVVNTFTQNTLPEVKRTEVQKLISMMNGTTLSTALNSVLSDVTISAKFTEIFGSSPDVLRSSRPRVSLNYPALVINELAVSNFSASTFHIDPTYSFVYSWKLDGNVVSTASSFSYIPSKNASGTHQIDLFVGKDDLSGNIDQTKPYYSQTIYVDVNNNILPTAPAIAINAATPSPRTVNSLSLDISTGAALTNCDSFSSLAVTDTATAPGVLQFNLNCTTAGTQTESVTFSSGEGARTMYLWAIDNEGSVSTPTTVVFIKDSVAPVASVSTASSSLKGGATESITLSAVDATSALTSLTLNFSETGSAPYTLVSSLATSATSYSWTVPSVDTSTGKLQLVAVDAAGLTTTVYSSAFSIDSQAPAAPALSRTSAANTTSANVTMTVGSCTDTSHILITTTNSQPASSASGWQACSTVASATLYSLSANGSFTLYAWAKDSVGNVAATANSVSMDYDNTNPTIVSGPTIAANVMGGNSYNITWSVTDAHTSLIDLEYYDGSAWNSIVTGTANTGTHSWAVPSSTNIPAAKLRLKATDSFANSSQVEGVDFIIDSTSPVLTAFTVANSIATVNTPTVSVQVTGTDNSGGSGLYQMRVSENLTYADDKWQTYSATSGSYSLSMSVGSKTVYIWAKDKAGNVSNRMSSSVALEFGIIPSLKFTGPSNLTDFADTEILHITWSCSTTGTLAAAPIKNLSYTTDNGKTLVQIDTDLTNNNSATTGYYDWALPAVLETTPFRLYVKCESSAGSQVEKMSDVYQTGGTWRVWAGQLSAKRDGIMAYGANKLVMPACSTSTIDGSGNVYYTAGNGSATTDKIIALMRINSVTGLIEKVVGDYEVGASSPGEDLTSGSLSSHKIIANDCLNVTAAVILGTSPDKKEVLFLDNGSPAKIYGITASNQARLYATLSGQIITKNFFRQSYFLSKDRIFFYFIGSRLYRLDLSTIGNSPVAIYGNGTATVDNVVGTEGTVSPLKTSGTAGTGNNVCNECTVLASASGDRIWVGGGYPIAINSTGTNTWARLDRNTTDGKYYISSNTATATRNMVNAIASDFDNKIYARGRNATNNMYIFDTDTEASTSVSVAGFNGLSGTFYYNLFSSVSNLYFSNVDQEIKVFNSDFSSSTLIAGNNANKIGDGKDPSEADFINANGLGYDATSGLLAIAQGANFRLYNFTDIASGFFSSVQSYLSSNAYSGASKALVRKNGENILYHPSTGGYWANLMSSTINLVSRTESSFVNLTTTPAVNYSATYDYEIAGIANGTALSNLSRFFTNPLGAFHTAAGYVAMVNHSNGNIYFQANSITGLQSYIYNLRASDSKVYKVAGVSGSAGYTPGQSGNDALTVQLGSSVSYMYEIRSGAKAGDLLFIDGTMIRRLSIVSDVIPKIYDVANMALATNFSSSTVFTDIYYDEASEITSTSGTGTFYYVRNAPTLEIHKWKASDALFAAAVDDTYTTTGLTLSGYYGLAKTPDGLLVLEKDQNRVLRLPP